MTTLLIAEHDNKILADANKKAMDAATKIGEEIHILVAEKIVQVSPKMHQKSQVYQKFFYVMTNYMKIIWPKHTLI